MSDPNEQELQEQVERTKALCAQIQQVLAGADDTEARSALAAAIAQRCLAHPNPDRSFLETMDAALGVFRESSNIKYRNEDTTVS